MNALALRRTDIYSYGLLFWQVMCNGHMPHTRIYTDENLKIVRLFRTSESDLPLTIPRFQTLKLENDDLFHLAIKTLDHRSEKDVPFEAALAVLRLTVRLEPDRRARGMDEITAVMRVASSGQSILVTPKPLKKSSPGICLTNVCFLEDTIEARLTAFYSFLSTFSGFDHRRPVSVL
jgi:serine/threonine protein kinase